MAKGLKAGTITDFAGSMADEMATAFLDEWKWAMDSQPIPDMNSQMRLMFVAIAKGIVKHLNENPGAFTVTVTNGQDTFTGAVTDVSLCPPDCT